mgnify:CR=1 FL=1
MLTRLPIVLLFSIAVLPHLDIGNKFIYLDDLPVIFILGLLAISIFKISDLNLSKAYELKYLYLWITLLVYTFFNPLIVLGNFSITTDFLRYTFLFSLLFLLFYLEDSNDLISKVSIALLVFLSLFSILSYFFRVNFGTDAYDYWNIGFNSNNWGFTPGRVNGLQAGGPNSFGDLIAILTLKVISDKKVQNIFYNLLILLGYLACFFTYSRSSIIVLVFFSTILLVYKNRKMSMLVLLLSILLTMNFGFIDRFISESETDGINDRIEMQSAAAGAIQDRSLKNSFFGYGFNQVAVVRSEIKPIDQFSDNLRPTGPHNGYVFQLLNYGYVGFLLFLSVLLYPVTQISSFKFEDLMNTLNIFPIIAFLVLNLAGDVFQNQSIAWIFWIYLFDLYKENS